MKPISFARLNLFVLLFGALLCVNPALAEEKKQPELKADAPKADPAKPGEPKAAPRTDLPPAREIIDRFTKEMGGEAYKAHKSEHAKGTVEMPAQQMKGTMEVFAAEPNKMVVKISLPGTGPVTTGFDGKVGFMVNPLLGPMLLEGKMLEQVASQADFDHILHNAEDYKSMETVDLTDFGGEECYKVKLVDKAGTESMEYFSKKTGLQRGMTMSQESPFGVVNVSTTIGDYKKVGDVTMPTRISQKMAGIEQVMTMDQIEFDTVQDDVFELPKEIKALIKK
jgi:hypothetical protein